MQLYKPDHLTSYFTLTCNLSSPFAEDVARVKTRPLCPRPLCPSVWDYMNCQQLRLGSDVMLHDEEHRKAVYGKTVCTV